MVFFCINKLIFFHIATFLCPTFPQKLVIKLLRKTRKRLLHITKYIRTDIVPETLSL